MKTSIIIPTLNRPDDLKKCLKGIEGSSLLPDEVIIIEQGNLYNTRQVIKQFNFPVKLEYFSEKSAAQARNYGVSISSGDIILFIDDDVVIASNYIQKVEEYFKINTDVKGVVGRDLITLNARRGFVSYLRRAVGLLFWRGSFRKHNCVLWSGHNVIKDQGDLETKAEWLSGLSSWRRSVFEEGFCFDRNYIRWSFGEDVTFSYQVFLKYPDSLRYLPDLHYYHYHSSGDRLANPAVIKMIIIYRYLFWKRFVHQGKSWRTIAYVWSQVGFSTLQLIETPSVKAFKSLMQGYWYLLNYRKSILDGSTDFNSFILGS